MNASVISKASVKDNVLDELAEELPVIISQVMEIPGGNLALVKPEQVFLEFSEANLRDKGSDIRIAVFARKNAPRTSKENVLANEILAKVQELIVACGEDYSIDIRIYLMDIGAAEHLP
jgi:hypothetical protein